MPENGQVAVKFHQPPRDLERYFTTFYCADITPDNDVKIVDSLHPEWAGLRFFSGSFPDSRIGNGQRLSGADAILTGPTSQLLHFSLGKTRFWGIGLLPLGWATFIGRPADAYANTMHNVRVEAQFAQFASLADLVLDPLTSEEQQLTAIETFFRDEAPRFGKEDPRIVTIHAVLLEPELPQVSEMAARCGLNQRTLERLCRKYFGFSPKILLRRQRFMRSVADFMLDPSMGWIGAIDSLYFDQSHFVRDCKDFLGMPPSEYSAMDHPVIAEFVRERMRVHGSAVQTLDDPE